MTLYTGPFNNIRQLLGEALLRDADIVDVGEWQSQDISDRPEMVTHELRHVIIQTPIPIDGLHASMETECNMPWAEDHFLERVSGSPLNPPPSEAWWPFAQRGNAAHKEGEQFSHTYPERFWPKRAGELIWAHKVGDPPEKGDYVDRRGIRFTYGDLEDVVQQLCDSPLTRQAYLPVWFPEDTGAVQGQRVPCTLGYHFIVREGWLDVTYFIRSCDFLRHFQDDVYMAMRLGQWVCEQISEIVGNKIQREVKPGDLVMHMVSLHVFQGDRYKMNKEFG